MIRKATLDDIGHIIKLTRDCAKFMISNNILQWNEHYPTRSTFKNDINRNEIYILEIEKEIVGCIVISTLMDKEYEPIEWLTPNKDNMYIHRLAVHPNHQGQGLARQLMSFAEHFTIDHGYNSIRLDTFSQNKRNQKFYELRGYKRLGHIYFPKQSEYPFYCYELVI